LTEQPERRWANDLERALDALAGADSVLGGVVATEDGLVLATHLPPGLDGEALAAAAAAAGSFAERALAGANWGDLEAVALEATKLKLLVCPLSVGYLLTVAEPDADLRPLVPRVTGAARDLDRTSMPFVGAPEGAGAL
jgi:predicted regulator of Ras-like GTPase activity (Roadblock/LC7/MglB family)